MGPQVLKEKSDQIRAGMRMMGLNDAVFNFAQLCSVVMWYLVPAFIATAVLFFIPGKQDVVSHSSFFYVYLLFYLTIVASAVQGLTLTAFFRHPEQSAGLQVFVIVVIVYAFGLFNQLIDETFGSGARVLVSLIPVAAFKQGIDQMVNYEAVGIGVTTETVAVFSDNYSFVTALLMLFLDIILWYLLWIYLEQLLPASGSIRAPWFFLQPSYYSASKLGRVTPNNNDLLTTSVTGNNSNDRMQKLISDGLVEVPSQKHQEMKESNQCVEVEGLGKVFKVRGNVLIAVDNVDFTMYRDEIFVLLGHNGAGKTTAISCLTGLMTPSSGGAKIFGRSLGEQLRHFRWVFVVVF